MKIIMSICTECDRYSCPCFGRWVTIGGFALGNGDQTFAFVQCGQPETAQTRLLITAVLSLHFESQAPCSLMIKCWILSQNHVGDFLPKQTVILDWIKLYSFVDLLQAYCRCLVILRQHMLVHKLPVVADLCIIGGGAAGFYTAIACAEKAVSRGFVPDILILEKSSKLLHKVSISGGGRCNVLHQHGVPHQESYPRGALLMEHLSTTHGALDSMRWFERKGVELKIEADGRVFPTSNTSQTIVDCFMSTAEALGIRVLQNAKVLALRGTSRGFCADVAGGAGEVDSVDCRRLAVCIGSAQKRSAQALLRDAGATVRPVAPSLFSLQFAATTASKFHGMEGLAVPDARVEISGINAQGPVLITHGGISGPAILRLSAWAAYIFQELNYKAILKVNWAPTLKSWKDMARSILEVPEGRTSGANQPARPPVRRKAISEVSPWPGVLPARLWKRLIEDADSESKLTEHFAQLSVFRGKTWYKTCVASNMPLIHWPWQYFGKAEAAEALARAMFGQITQYQLEVDGRRLNKDEFVTAGGVNWEGLDWNSMELTSCPGVHFAGEAVDVDGITGGFNFQGCWSSGYVAGVSAANTLYPDPISQGSEVDRWNRAKLVDNWRLSFTIFRSILFCIEHNQQAEEHRSALDALWSHEWDPHEDLFGTKWRAGGHGVNKGTSWTDTFGTALLRAKRQRSIGASNGKHNRCSADFMTSKSWARVTESIKEERTLTWCLEIGNNVFSQTSVSPAGKDQKGAARHLFVFSCI